MLGQLVARTARAVQNNFGWGSGRKIKITEELKMKIEAALKKVKERLNGLVAQMFSLRLSTPSAA